MCFEGEEWEVVSWGAKRLIETMLTKDVSRRPNARELLNDEWLAQCLQHEDAHIVQTTTALQNLKKFHAGCKLRQATLQYIAWQFVSPEDTDSLKRVFIALDSDNDGKLSKEDLEANFRETFPAESEDVERIMSSIDCDGNGYIDFHEFLMATLNWKQILTTEVMENAFKAFDADGNGEIRVRELRAMLEGEQEVDSGVWTEVLQDVDMDGNGAVSFTQIDLEEFKAMVKRASLSFSKDLSLSNLSHFT